MVVQHHILALRSAGNTGGVTGIDEFPRLESTCVGARLLHLCRESFPVKLVANQNAGIGVAISISPMVKVTQESQRLAFRGYFFRRVGIGSRFRLLRSLRRPLLRYRGTLRRLLGKKRNRGQE